jgi:hypothetical protein
MDAAQNVVETFLCDLPETFGMERVHYGIESKLGEYCGYGRDTGKVSKALQDTNSLDSLMGRGERFKETYQAQNDGRDRPVDPWVRGRWYDAVKDKEALENANDENMRTLSDFANWSNGEVLPSNDITGSKGM